MQCLIVNNNFNYSLYKFNKSLADPDWNHVNILTCTFQNMALHQLSVTILKARKSGKKNCDPKNIEKYVWNLLNTRTLKKYKNILQ